MFLKSIPRNISTNEYRGQLIRSSSSVGANYIEAIEAISKKDFIHRLRICRKETRESIHWLFLIQKTNLSSRHINTDTNILIKEAQELVKIFTSSIITSERNQKTIK